MLIQCDSRRCLFFRRGSLCYDLLQRPRRLVELRESVPFACPEIDHARFGPRDACSISRKPPAKNALREDRKEE
jgi:hypothetical protein